MIGYKGILPSGLVSERQPIDVSFSKKVNQNMTLKNGVVLEIYEVTDEKNQSKLVPEYDVMVVENDNTSIYKNCMAVDGFGGKADYSQVKYRKPDDPKKVKDSGSLKDQNGSIVLLLCLEGSAEQAIIVGSLNHPSKKDVLTEDKGHHLEGEFNGLNWQIDKDGSLIIKFNSATDNDGTPQDEEAGGTYVSMTKEGSVDINTGEGSEQILIDKPNKDISVTAGNNINTKSEADTSAESGANYNVKAGADFLLDATGKAGITAGSQFSVDAKSQVEVKSPMVSIKGDSMVKVESNTINLNGNTVLVGGPGTPALVFTTQFLGVGNLGAPVLSQAIGPFSSKVFIAN